MRCRGGRFPHRCAVSDRPLAGNPLQRVESPVQQVGFLLHAHALDRFVQVAVMGHLVPVVEDPANEIGMPLSRVTRAEKCRAQFVQQQHRNDSRHVRNRTVRLLRHHRQSSAVLGINREHRRLRVHVQFKYSSRPLSGRRSDGLSGLGGILS